MSPIPTVRFLADGGLFLYHFLRKEDHIMELDDDLFPFEEEEKGGSDV